MPAKFFCNECGKEIWQEMDRGALVTINELEGQMLCSDCIIMMSPRYTHNCHTCIFLGRFKQYDLYFCLQSLLLPTVVARYSDISQDYVSGLKTKHFALTEAKRRATSKKLLPKEEKS